MKVKYLEDSRIREGKCAFLPYQYTGYYQLDNDVVFNCSDDQLRSMIAEGNLKKVKNLAYDTVDVVKYGLVDSDSRDVDAVILGNMRRRRPSGLPVYVSAGWLKRHAEKFIATPKSAYAGILSNLTDWTSYDEIKASAELITMETSKLDDSERIYVSRIYAAYSASKLTKFATQISDDNNEYSTEFDCWNTIIDSPALVCFAYDSNSGEDMFVRGKRIHFHSVYDDRRMYLGNFNFDSTNVPIITNRQFTRVMNENNVMTLDASIIESFNEADDAGRKVLASVICNANMKDPETVGIVAYLAWEYNLRAYCTTADYQLIDSMEITSIWNAESYFKKVKQAGGIVTDAVYDMIAKSSIKEIKYDLMSDLKKMCGMNTTLLKKICQKLGVVDYTGITLKEIKKETEYYDN